MEKESKIFVAGHRGLVGSAIVRKLIDLGYSNIIFATRSECDLTSQDQTTRFFSFNQPEYVFLAAAKVGGIRANNSYPAEFIYNNLQIQLNVINASYLCGVRKLLFLGSSCVYPKFAPQPIQEADLLTGMLEPTNEAYAIAKIAGLIMCRSYNRQYKTNFISVMPTNLYGINDHYHPEDSHVIPALIRKFHEAKILKESVVKVWGNGNSLREFLYSDDLARACVLLMEKYESDEIINIGSGEEISILALALLIRRIVGYAGNIEFDNKLDGTPRKLLDSSKIRNFGWRNIVSLEDGLSIAYEDFKERLEQNEEGRRVHD